MSSSSLELASGAVGVRPRVFVFCFESSDVLGFDIVLAVIGKLGKGAPNWGTAGAT